MTFKPMLAAPTDGTNLQYPLLASPKLDGIRCLIIGGKAMSRSLKPIPNKYIQSIIGSCKLNGMDGELIVGNETDSKVFTNTSSGVMTRDGEPDFIFRVFDDFSNPKRFLSRINDLEMRINRLPLVLLQTIKFVTHISILDYSELLTQELNYIEQGYEGIMLRKLSGDYKYGRSTLKEGHLLKMKRFEDSEAVIIDANEFMINNNEKEKDELGYSKRSSKKDGKTAGGKLGSLIVRDIKTKVEFEIGSGFDENQRINLWKLRHDIKGEIVKYKHQKAGAKDKPRFPVFLGFRHKEDM